MADENSASAPKPLATPYQLDLTQTTLACKALMKNIAEAKKTKLQKAESNKRDLLVDEDDANEDTVNVNDVPVWMVVTTKKHISDKTRLKPTKIAIPNSFNTANDATICLITADPSSAFTAALESPAFPSSLKPRITRIIDISKLKTSYHDYEARRRLMAEHDIFLADERIITYLPQILGKVFYKGGSKRPVPISIAPPAEKGEDGKRVKLDPAAAQRKRDGKAKSATSKGAASPQVIAGAVERALTSALVHLAPGVTTAIKVGLAGMPPEAIRSNIEAVMKGLTEHEKLIPNGWRNVRAVYVKGPESIAFPIWLTSELWVNEADIKDTKPAYGKKKDAAKAIEGAPAAGTKEEPHTISRKRKADASGKSSKQPDADKHAKKKRKADVAGGELAKEAALRKEMLKKQKEDALAEVV